MTVVFWKKYVAFAPVWLGPPPHSKASGVTLSTNEIIDRGVLVFNYMQPECGAANKMAAAAAGAVIGEKEQQETLWQVGMVHILPYPHLPFYCFILCRLLYTLIPGYRILLCSSDWSLS